MFKYFPIFAAPARIAVRLILLQIIFVLLPASAQYRLKPNLDAAQFQDKTGQVYLEIYYSLPETAVQYLPDQTGALRGRLLFALQIYQNRALWASKSWKIEKTLADSTQKAQHLVDVVTYLIDKPGQYRLALQVKDLNQPDRLDSTESEVTIRLFSPQQLELSDVELATTIKPCAPEAPKIFVKHTQEIIPNVAALFGESAPELYYYFETYHLRQNVPGTQYKIFCRIHHFDERNNSALETTWRTRKKQVDSSVEMGKINVSQLPSGKYRLVYGVSDSAAVILASREKIFFVYNPAITVTNVSAVPPSATDMTGLDAKMLEDEFDRMFFLTAASDRKFYKSLTNLNAKREFLASLWQASPHAGNLSGAAYRRQYLARTAEAETRFKSALRPGWKSDRGRIFILYGAPDNIERFPSSTTTLPHEIWTYDTLKGQGGVVFVFADRNGFNNYEQIHATLQGELQDPDWQRFISRGSGGDNINMNSMQP